MTQGSNEENIFFKDPCAPMCEMRVKINVSGIIQHERERE